MLSVFSFPAFCQGGDMAERGRLSAELLDVSGARSAVERTFELIVRTQAAQITGSSLSSSDRGKVSAAHAKVVEAIAAEMCWERFEPEYIKLYAETFTSDELVSMIEFFKSPAGRRLVGAQPELMRRGMEIIEGVSATLLPKLLEKLGANPAQPSGKGKADSQ